MTPDTPAISRHQFKVTVAAYLPCEICGQVSGAPCHFTRDEVFAAVNTPTLPPSHEVWEQVYVTKHRGLMGLHVYQADAVDAAKAADARQTADLTNRKGCVCRCCDHGEGSDCACDCHAAGLCSSIDFPVQVASLTAQVEIERRMAERRIDDAEAERDAFKRNTDLATRKENEQLRGSVDRLAQDKEEMRQRWHDASELLIDEMRRSAGLESSLQQLRQEHERLKEEMVEVLAWAERQFAALVTDDIEGYGTFIRGTNTELSGFVIGRKRLRALRQQLTEQGG